MRRVRTTGLTAALAATVVLLTGCNTEGGAVSELTWQEAKAEAQRGEDQIVALIPSDQVASSEQNTEGVLLSCDTTRHQWSGRTTVTLTPDTDSEAVATAIASHFRGSDEYTVKEDRADGQPLIVQLVAADNEENYLVAVGVNPDQLEVSSASRCFTLPEGTYPGGKF